MRDERGRLTTPTCHPERSEESLDLTPGPFPLGKGRKDYPSPMRGGIKGEVTPSVAVESLGCKLNQAEAASWARELRRAGYRIVDSAEKAQIYILNTCTVTHVADRKSRHLLREARRKNPEALIVAAGCYAERAPQEIAETGGVGLIVGNEEKARLMELIQASRKGYLLCHSEPFALCHSERSEESRNPQDRLREESSDPSLALRVTNACRKAFRTRSLVKIQDGCDEFCTYCIVPLVRGRQRSRPISEVVSEVKERVAEGYQEVVLTGTQVGAYGRDRPSDGDLCTLARRILAETALARLRLTSLHPQDLSDDLLSLWQEERFCCHLHLSLQSGSDSVLRRMGRGYTTAACARAATLAREGVPDLALTTDVIVGFPGESDAEFEESYRFCARMGFARIHVFAYSARPGTVAAAMPRSVDELTKKRRSRAMLALAEKASLRFREQFLGRRLTVLWETVDGNDGSERVWSGLTSNYLKVYSSSGEELSNRLLGTSLMRPYRDGVWGELALPVGLGT